MTRSVVCGAGGFIGGHLVRHLKAQGHWVRGFDITEPEFAATAADEFVVGDLRDQSAADAAVSGVDEVYQLAADMGGMGFIHSAECEIMRPNVSINLNVIDAAARADIERYFFSSSVCIYRDMDHGEAPLDEAGAYPALPDNEYGWEKLHSERTALAYGRKHGFDVRIARFQNCFGPMGTWTGGREKAPAAICRKGAEADDGGTIEVWGDGTAVRSYIFVADMVDTIYRLMHSDLEGPANIGISEYVTVDELVATVAAVAGKEIGIVHVDGPVGVQSRNFSHERIESTGWRPRFSLADGIGETYPWVAAQVAAARAEVS